MNFYGAIMMMSRIIQHQMNFMMRSDIYTTIRI